MPTRTPAEARPAPAKSEAATADPNAVPAAAKAVAGEVEPDAQASQSPTAHAATEAAVAQPSPPAAQQVVARAVPAPAAAPAPPASGDALKFDFASVESDTNAWVTGPLVVPPSPDIKYHNRKPSYPPAAARQGEQGKVILLAHVTPDGLVSSVDVIHSSGFADLDRAAREAVETWHFLPSIKDGQPVPAVMPIGFEFALD